nr:MAG TPA: hypothetical protein [Caudoviricetes sp.]
MLRHSDESDNHTLPAAGAGHGRLALADKPAWKRFGTQ